MKIYEIISEAIPVGAAKSATSAAGKVAGKVVSAAEKTAKVPKLIAAWAERIGIGAAFANFFYKKYQLDQALAANQITPEVYGERLRIEKGYVVAEIAAFYAGAGIIKTGAALINWIPRLLLPRFISKRVIGLVNGLKPAALAALVYWLNSTEGRYWMATLTFDGALSVFDIENGTDLLHWIGDVIEQLVDKLEGKVRELANLPPAEPRIGSVPDEARPGEVDDTPELTTKTGPVRYKNEYTPKGMKRDAQGNLIFDPDSL